MNWVKVFYDFQSFRLEQIKNIILCLMIIVAAFGAIADSIGIDIFIPLFKIFSNISV